MLVTPQIKKNLFVDTRWLLIKWRRQHNDLLSHGRGVSNRDASLTLSTLFLFAFSGWHFPVETLTRQAKKAPRVSFIIPSLLSPYSFLSKSQKRSWLFFPPPSFFFSPCNFLLMGSAVSVCSHKSLRDISTITAAQSWWKFCRHLLLLFFFHPPIFFFLPTFRTTQD